MLTSCIQCAALNITVLALGLDLILKISLAAL